MLLLLIVDLRVLLRLMCTQPKPNWNDFLVLSVRLAVVHRPTQTLTAERKSKVRKAFPSRALVRTKNV